ncbi:MAG: DUF1707 domain-containing protein [Frankiaceae bacterium]
MDRSVRASDADRDRVADALRRHFSEGRLSPEEFDERLTSALAARTVGDLADLVADLPQDPDGYALPVPVSGSGSARLAHRPTGGAASVVWRAQLASYVTVSLICVIIWFAGGHNDSFWPIWVIGPWGIVILGRAIRGPGAGGPLDGRNRNR